MEKQLKEGVRMGCPSGKPGPPFQYDLSLTASKLEKQGLKLMYSKASMNRKSSKLNHIMKLSTLLQKAALKPLPFLAEQLFHRK